MVMSANMPPLAAMISAVRRSVRIGVSESRLRHLRNEDPNFPDPAPVEGVTLYNAADVDEYKRRPRKPGRPPKAS
jgi:hypothetical protein